MKYLFIGEERSKRAIEINARWESGKLCARNLFDAIEFAGIDKNNCSFMNLFEPLRQQGILMRSHRLWIITQQLNGKTVVAMGNKVSKRLTELKVEHIKIIHPAARGKIRLKALYLKHVKETIQHPKCDFCRNSDGHYITCKLHPINYFKI